MVAISVPLYEAIIAGKARQIKLGALDFELLTRLGSSWAPLIATIRGGLTEQGR
jgi:hypothetical protein